MSVTIMPVRKAADPSTENVVRELRTIAAAIESGQLEVQPEKMVLILHRTDYGPKGPDGPEPGKYWYEVYSVGMRPDAMIGLLNIVQPDIREQMFD